MIRILVSATLILPSLVCAAEDEAARAEHAEKRAEPAPRYWDAESWEKGSSLDFWRVAKPSPSPIVAAKPAQAPPTEPKIFHRQTEK